MDPPVNRLRDLYLEESGSAHPADDDTVNRLFAMYHERAEAASPVPASGPEGDHRGLAGIVRKLTARRKTT